MFQRVMLRFSIFCRKFIVSQCRKYSQVNPSVLFFRKLPVAKKLMNKSGEYQDFPSEIFWLTVPTKFRRVIIYCCSFSGYRKSLDKKGGVPRFSVKNFLSQSTENFCRGILHSCINFGYRKGLDKRGAGVSSISVENSLFHSVEKFLRGIL